MQDPRDPGTLDLVEACQRPLTGAERQKRRREKLKKLREAGRLFDLQVTADELDAMRAALCDYAERFPFVAAYGDLADSLWRRLTVLRVGKYYDGDPVWSREALQAEAERVRQRLSGDGAGPCLSVADLLYLWRAVDSLVTLSPEQLEDAEVCERLQRIFAAAPWWKRGGLEQLGQCPEAGYQRKEIDRAFADSGALRRQLEEQTTRAQAAERALRLSGDLASRAAWLEQENARVIEERGRAFRAVEVLTQRLRDAGLSTDYRG